MSNTPSTDRELLQANFVAWQVAMANAANSGLITGKAALAIVNRAQSNMDALIAGKPVSTGSFELEYGSEDWNHSVSLLEASLADVSFLTKKGSPNDNDATQR